MPRAKKKKENWESSFEQRVEDFGEELGQMGERFGSRAEDFGKEVERGWHGTFGIIGPVIASIFGIICLVVVAWILGFLGSRAEISFLLAVRGFLLENIGLFFLLFLFFNYAEYLSKASRRAYRPFSPIVKAAGVIVAFWILANIILALGFDFPIIPIKGIAALFLERIFWVFGFLVAVGYLVLILASREAQPRKEERFMASSKKMQQAGSVKRLYRSGKDKILGGVCGGIAEYLEVDPVLIRLLWVFGTLISLGTGILLYIIAWIIIPRNPGHKWD